MWSVRAPGARGDHVGDPCSGLFPGGNRGWKTKRFYNIWNTVCGCQCICRKTGDFAAQLTKRWSEVLHETVSWHTCAGVIRLTALSTVDTTTYDVSDLQWLVAMVFADLAFGRNRQWFCGCLVCGPQVTVRFPARGLRHVSDVSAVHTRGGDDAGRVRRAVQALRRNPSVHEWMRDRQRTFHCFVQRRIQVSGLVSVGTPVLHSWRAHFIVPIQLLLAEKGWCVGWLHFYDNDSWPESSRRPRKRSN